jgi:hypothetical protein
MFRVQLMIWGCMKTFSRRDALERHASDDGDMAACKKGETAVSSAATWKRGGGRVPGPRTLEEIFLEAKYADRRCMYRIKMDHVFHLPVLSSAVSPTALCMVYLGPARAKRQTRSEPRGGGPLCKQSSRNSLPQAMRAGHTNVPSENYPAYQTSNYSDWGGASLRSYPQSALPQTTPLGGMEVSQCVLLAG